MDCRVHQTSLSMGFSRREYWSGLPFPPPVDLPNLGIKTESPMDPIFAGRFFTTEATRELYTHTHTHTHTHILFKDMELNELMEGELNVDGSLKQLRSCIHTHTHTHTYYLKTWN